MNSPLTPLLLGAAIVLGVGFWVLNDKPAATDTTQGRPSASGGQSGQPTGQAGGSSGTGGAKPAANQAPAEKVPAEQIGTERVGTEQKAPDGTAGADKAAEKSTVEKPPAAQVPTTPPPSNASTSRDQIDRSGGAAQTMLVTTYFADGLKNGMSLQPVEIKVPRTVGRITTTVEQLLNPPVELSLISSFPSGTRSLGPNLKDGVAIIDLSPEVAEVRGSHAVNTIVASLVYSLTEIPEVQAVQLWVNGHPAKLDGFEWAQPLGRSDLEGRNWFQVEPVIKYTGQ